MMSESQPWVDGSSPKNSKMTLGGTDTQSSPSRSGVSIASSKPVIGEIKKTAPDGNGGDVKSKEITEKKSIEQETAKKAKTELLAYLTSKGLELSKAAGVKIVLAPRSRGSSNATDPSSTIPGYDIKYRMPDGKDLMSKADVCLKLGGGPASQVKGAPTKLAGPGSSKTPINTAPALSSPTGPDSQIRSDAFSTAKKKVDHIREHLPTDVDGIKLLDLGSVDPRRQFHNSIQIYPINYKAEIVIEKNERNEKFINEVDVLPQRFQCVIKSTVEHKPVFILKNLDTGMEVRMKTEQGAFRQHFPRIASGNEPGAEPWSSIAPFSFFNLQVELLIEGLPGALACKDYQYHIQRGYGTTYTGRSKAADNKKMLVLKRAGGGTAAGISAFSNSNSSGKSGSGGASGSGTDDRKAAAEARKALQDEKKRAREEVQRRREEEKAASQAAKAASKKSKAEAKLAKQRQDAADKARKEATRHANQAVKYRTAYRTEAKKFVARSQKEAAAMVLDAFDIEENAQGLRRELLEELEMEKGCVVTLGASVGEDVDDKATAGEDSGVERMVMDSPATRSRVPGDLSEVIQSQSISMSAKFSDDSTFSERMWEVVLRLSVFLQTHDRDIGLQVDTSPAALSSMLCEVSSLLHPSTTVSNAQASNAATDGSMREANSPSEAKSGSDQLAMVEEEEATFDDNDSSPPTPSLSQGTTIAALDRIQLCLVQSLQSEIHAVLDFEEGSGLSMPLNQLTWPEATRLILMHHILKHCGVRKEDLQHALRGSRAMGFRSARNVARLIRYRMQARCAQSQILAARGKQTPALALELSNPDKDHSGMTTTAPSDRVMGLYSLPEAGLCPLVAAPNTPWVPSSDDLEDSGLPFNLFEPDGLGILTGALMAIITDGRSEASASPGQEAAEGDTLGTAQASSDAKSEYARDTFGNESLGNAKPYTEVYKRCARVLHKLVTNNAAKNVLWETAFYSDYLDVVKYPMSLSNIASRLVLQKYGSGDANQKISASDAYATVAYAFYNDLRSALCGVHTFFTEAQPFLAHTQRLSVMAWRFCQQWLLSLPERRTPLEKCTDAYCMLSGNEIKPLASMKCGRCAAVYCLDALHIAPVSPWLVKPTQDVVDKQTEEWFCEICVKEDTSLMKVCPPASRDEDTSMDIEDGTCDENVREEQRQEVSFMNSFFQDEHGPSSLIPWVLNPKFSRAIDALSYRDPKLKLYKQALSILIDHSLSGTTSCGPCPHGESPWTFTMPTTGTLSPRPWTVSERLTVLSSLAEVLLTLPSTYAQVYEQGTELCQKLLRLSAVTPFKETEFLRTVKELVGEDGVTMVKPILKAISADKTAGDASAKEFDDVDQYRDRAAEDDLMGRLLDIRAADDPKPAPAVPRDLVRAKAEQERLLAAKMGSCQYCGKTEVELCSPMVIGHSALDHDMHANEYNDKAKLWARRSAVFKDQTSQNPADTTGNDKTNDESVTRVHLFSGFYGTLGPGPMPLPYFPRVHSSHGQRLIDEMRRLQPHVSPIRVHQLCALHMFRARLDRHNFELRKRRRAVAEKVIAMSGLNLTALGVDRDGREYWKLPGTNALFICEDLPPDQDKQQFLSFLNGKGQIQSTKVKLEGDVKHHPTVIEGGRWKVLDSNEGVRRVLDAMYSNADIKEDSPDALKMEGTLHSNLSELLRNGASFADPEPIKGSRNKAKNTVAKDEANTGTEEKPVIEVKPEPEQEQEQTPAVAKVSETVDMDTQERPAMPEAAGTVPGPSLSEGAPEKESKKESDSAEPVVAVSVPERVKRESSYNSLNGKPGTGGVTDSLAGGTNVLPDNQPVDIRYVPSKGHVIQRNLEILEESAFEQRPVPGAAWLYGDVDSDEEEEDTAYEEYLVFPSRHRKYAVVALYNQNERKVRLAKGDCAVIYSISRLPDNMDSDSSSPGATVAAAMKGMVEPLVTIDLSEPWNDGAYYFTIPNFRRAGIYQISFSVEPLEGYIGPTLSLVRPFVTTVNVTSKRIICGLQDARNKLMAFGYINKSGRRAMIDRIRYSGLFEERIADPGKLTSPSAVDDSELDACKSALLTVFAALPEGGLTLDVDADGYSGAPTGAAEALGWNDILEDVWYESLEHATNPVHLMECVLLLEYYLSKAILDQPVAKLLASLSAPHMALRTPSLAAVATRIFVLDRSINYDKVETRRSRRGGGFDGIPGTSNNATSSSSSGRRGRTSTSRNDVEDGDDEDDYGFSSGRRRSGRAASALAQGRIKKQSYADDEDYFEESPRESPRTVGTEQNAGPADCWVCPVCTMSNSLRARSCEACGARRSNAVTNTAVVERPKQKKRKKVVESDDEEEEEEEDEEEENDEEEEEQEDDGMEIDEA